MPAISGRELVKRWGLFVGVAFLLVLPLLAFVVWLHRNDRWAPVFDLAIFEMHVRDVGTAHTPLLGLGGRLGRLQNGSHPGPLAYYLLAPFYRLLGGSYWALRTSMAAMNGIAIMGALAMIRRRTGASGLLLAGVAIALLDLGYGLSMLTEPWNPHLPVLWFVTFLAAVYSVADGDRRMLPVVAATGCICAEIHVSYIALCGGIGLFALVPFVRSWARAEGITDRREHARSCLLSAGIVAVLWTPPVIEELTHSPGNLTLLVDYFAHPPDESVGAGRALSLALAHLDLLHLVRDAFAAPGAFRLEALAHLGLDSSLQEILSTPEPNDLRGSVFLALWAVAALFTPKGERRLARLHGLVLVALVVFFLAVSRIIGMPWVYLMFPGWAIGAGMLLAMIATVATLVSRVSRVSRQTSDRGPGATVAAAAAGVALLAACAVRLAVTVDQTGSSTPTQTAQLAVIAPQAAAGLWLRAGAATGTDGTYVITSSDALGLAGGLEYGLLNELERRGFRAFMPPQYEWIVGPHRILPEAAATARVHLTTGGFIGDAKRIPGAVLVAYAEPRSEEGRREYDSLRAQVTTAIRETGHGDVADRIDWDLAAAGRVPGLSPYVGLAMWRMGDLGLPAAVFIEPITARVP